MDDTETRLPTGLWLDAQLRAVALRGIPYTVINKGAYASGTVMVKIYVPATGALLYQQQRNLDGVMGWMILFKGEIKPENEVDDYIRRAVDRDPDIWAIEIEDKEQKMPFEGQVF